MIFARHGCERMKITYVLYKGSALCVIYTSIFSTMGTPNNAIRNHLERKKIAYFSLLDNVGVLQRNMKM